MYVKPLNNNFGVYAVHASFTHSDESDNELSTAAIVAVSMVGTFLFTIVFTTMINITIFALYCKYQCEKKLKSTGTNKHGQFDAINNKEIKMDTNPSYSLLDGNTIRGYTDTSHSTTQFDTKNIRMSSNPSYTPINSMNVRMEDNPSYSTTQINSVNIRLEANPSYSTTEIDAKNTTVNTNPFSGMDAINSANSTTDTDPSKMNSTDPACNTNLAYGSARIDAINPDYTST